MRLVIWDTIAPVITPLPCSILYEKVIAEISKQHNSNMTKTLWICLRCAKKWLTSWNSLIKVFCNHSSTLRISASKAMRVFIIQNENDISTHENRSNYSKGIRVNLMLSYTYFMKFAHLYSRYQGGYTFKSNQIEQSVNVIYRDITKKRYISNMN